MQNKKANGSLTKFGIIAAVLISAFMIFGFGVFMFSGGLLNNEQNPSIVVHTVFEDSMTTSSGIDVTFTALSSPGATVTEVTYTINGMTRHIYLSGMGTLGQGRVFLVPGENRIEFAVADTAGRTASFIVPAVPYYDWGFLADYDSAIVIASAMYPGLYLESNRLVVFARRDASIRQVDAVAADMGARIVSRVNGLGMHLFEFDINPGSNNADIESALLNLAQELEQSHPYVISGAFLNTVEEITDAGTNDPWSGGGVTDSPWALEAINAPQAWADFGHLFHNIAVGVMDTGTRHDHPDLNIPPGNVLNRRTQSETTVRTSWEP